MIVILIICIFAQIYIIKMIQIFFTPLSFHSNIVVEICNVNNVITFFSTLDLGNSLPFKSLT